ncbi:hypothetical protein [Eubacterium maltosivorans]|uniref:hypothetical protein n=1 Tax=Eubacterium maltosivorans TaxID=2041044 RepID=UPI0009447F16|nr:hypothetical protein [Eubacterium maltosivorans]
MMKSNQFKHFGIIKSVKFLMQVVIFCVSAMALVYAIFMKLSPNDAPKFFGYKPYVILTNSMVPTLPVGSLVIDHAIAEDDPIPENTPITFKAELQGQEVFVTHYFRYIDTSDGYDRYMTQGEGYQEGQYDEFEIHREDIVGTYAFHIPYLGRVALFLQSPAALTMFLLWAFILMMEHMVKKWLSYKYPEDEEDLMKPRHRVKARGVKPPKGRYLRGETPRHRPPSAPPLKRPSMDEIKG